MSDEPKRQVLLGPLAHANPSRLDPPFDIVEWQPGRMIHTRRAAASTGGLALAGVAGAVFTGLLTWFFVGQVGGVDLPLALPIACGVGLLGAAAAAGWAWWAYREREIQLDWRRREARFRNGTRLRVCPLSDLHGVRLIATRQVGGRQRRDEYYCDLRLTLTAGEEWLLRTGYAFDPETPRGRADPLGQELARVLGVPYNAEE